MTEKIPNHLVNQDSPYLIQHAYNPVDWYPWGEAALKKAREENKLLVISIGYAACHWCHVMEHESFEDNDVAQAMNNLYISIKVDREERPDVDNLYMNSCQVISGRGGWPLNIIALPDQRPVFAGTYFSKRDWIYLLDYFADIHRLHPEELEKMAHENEQGLKSILRLPSVGTELLWKNELPEEIVVKWKMDLDFINGGTYGAPKFPMPSNLSALLFHGHRSKNHHIQKYVQLTLEKMAMGGIFDQLGGGFSRYSVDGNWNVPHFEKMLYDNAQLLSLYANSYRLVKKDPTLKVINETIAFIDRELTSPEGLFYSSIDADSEGHEGKYYVWTSNEIIELLSGEAALFLDYFSCTTKGNWENSENVLRIASHINDFSGRNGLTQKQLESMISTWKETLMKTRENRIPPDIDKKILTCWNGLLISGLVDSYRAVGDPGILQRAVRAGLFYREQGISGDGMIWRNLSSSKNKIPGFLDDYAFLIKAFLDLYQVTLELDWLRFAEKLTDQVQENFNAEDGIFFQLSPASEKPLIQPCHELSDNVIPSSNSQMARNLFVLGHINGRNELIMRAQKMLSAILPQVKRSPAFHANWFTLLEQFIAGPIGIIITGRESMEALKEFNNFFNPDFIFSGSKDGFGLPQFKDGDEQGKTMIYVCRNKTCFPPVNKASDAIVLISQ